MAGPALTAGTWQLTAAALIQGAKIAPQGTAATITLAYPTCDETGSDEQQLTYGTGSGEADVLCAADFAVTAGGSITLDLLTGTDLKNVFGGDAPIVKLKGVYIGVVSGSDDTSGVTVGNAAANCNQLFFGAQNDTWTIYPSGCPMIGGKPAGVTVDATNRNLKIANGGAADAVVRVMVAGSSV